ncbi:MAG: recombination protein RecR [Deltaproteobacteria bacterium GWA2_38_16]|nr:MAG: recombination protein RecR [Deltaproteobacteria bacterium GWA2_38_16]OGQ03417.1 MAG: recombination protein RecR [Deltaproteobacteria bacterium RIFCSPHIGHO2_02_FULL_38_15]OGQ30092.1 MAG: recombination protein RecR [Deltaproteobacteria bacterium RIFCSPLOWO2_01_FULL_38_9]HBQ21374.1 recombination protein RecR [Deltaproteobacteria bacterium]
MSSSNPLLKLVNELSKLPGIGEKTATRLAFFILKSPSSYPQALAQAILEVKNKIKLCSLCFNLTEEDPCSLCDDSQRDKNMLCVVEDPTDLLAIEKTKIFRGKYHILHGTLSPLEGIGPEHLKIKELVSRIQKEKIEEVILATNTSVEGETTALYLIKLLKPFSIKLTRIAQGIPMGGDLEYMDSMTIGNALEHRILV